MNRIYKAALMGTVLALLLFAIDWKIKQETFNQLVRTIQTMDSESLIQATIDSTMGSNEQ